MLCFMKPKSFDGTTLWTMWYLRIHELLDIPRSVLWGRCSTVRIEFEGFAEKPLDMQAWSRSHGKHVHRGTVA